MARVEDGNNRLPHKELQQQQQQEEEEQQRWKKEEQEGEQSASVMTAAHNANHNNSTTTTTTTTGGEQRVQYGAAIPVETTGKFPEVGSTLGPYFCLGTLGKGTFSSIHKCINLAFAHQQQQKQTQKGNQSSHHNSNHNSCRLAAAKVELSDFANSGVLLGEALVLHFLDEALPQGTVPRYMGHYTAGGGEAAAIVMEYLPGEDMHQLRENRNRYSPTGKAPRRLTIEDAVYLTADVMLPLLEQMHNVGIVHRDVKPSNCVRSKHKQFCLVDFGLSKSTVVPMDSGYADPKHPWPKDQPWLVPPSSSDPTTRSNNQNQNHRGVVQTPPPPHHQPPPPGCIRKERTSADFRGTSMYASPRVHQGRDYCPRDDVWSLLYVFCDLVSGGLPWMSYAANRDRDACQRIKERVHGLPPGGNLSSADEESSTANTATTATDAVQNKNKIGKPSNTTTTTNNNNKNAPRRKDETELLLMGDDYHVAMYKHKQREANKTAADGTTAATTSPMPQHVPKPLDMSKDKTKIDLLRRAFQHVANLQFWDRPDYKLIQRCIRGFLDEEGAVGEEDDVEIEWKEEEAQFTPEKKRKRDSKVVERPPTWEFQVDSGSEDRMLDMDPLVNTDLFENLSAPPPTEPSLSSAAVGVVVPEQEAAVRRLPLERQFRIAQMEYHAKSPKTAPPHIVLRDWMKVAIPLLYDEWDSKAYEKGGHRTSTDGYRRECYLELVEKCSKWAKLFDNFSKEEYYGIYSEAQENGCKVEEGEVPPKKRKKIVSTFGNPSGGSNESAVPNDLASVSKVIFGLMAASRAERTKSFAPPPLLSFGLSR